MKYNLSIVLPSIRNHLLSDFYNSIIDSIGEYSFELIIVSPTENNIPNYNNVKFIRDYGSPSRCLQIGALIAEGKYLTWGSDDGTYSKNSLKECIDLLETKSEKDAIIIRYYEAVNKNGQLPDDSYWKAWTHADQRLPGIPEDYYCCPVGMYNLEYFISIGGIDCRYRHINMNAHSLAFRVQNDGGKFYLSPSCVLECDFDNNTNHLHRALDIAYATIDGPLYKNTYLKPYDPNFIKIDYNNWKEAPSIWERFK